MSTLVVSYNDLEDAVKDAKKAAALLEEYAETIEDKICKRLKDYSGAWTSNIDEADRLINDKVEQLRQKKVDFETLASNIETFKNNCVTADNNVKAAIESLSGDFKNTYGIKENIVTKWFNYISTELGNSSALGRYLKDIGDTIEVAVTDGIENIKDWYKYEGGKYIVDDILTVALVAVEVVGAVVAIASGVGAIVAIATVIATTMTVANGLTSIYNNSKAYNAMQNENPAWAMRYAGRDTLTEQMRETSDSKLVHNLATGLDVLETSAGLILFAKDGTDALKSIKNFTGKCKIMGNGSTKANFADLMSPEDASRYNDYWKNSGIGSDKTFNEYMKYNPNSTIDDYMKLIKEQSPWPEGYNSTDNIITLKEGDTFKMVLDKKQKVTQPGGFGILDDVPSVDFARNDMAIKLGWKIDCGKLAEFRVKPGVELKVPSGPIGPQIDLKADKYLTGNNSLTQLDLFNGLGKINRNDYIEVVPGSVKKLK